MENEKILGQATNKNMKNGEVEVLEQAERWRRTRKEMNQ